MNSPLDPAFDPNAKTLPMSEFEPMVRRILDAPKSPTEGEGVMRGQMLAPPVRILTARRSEPAK